MSNIDKGIIDPGRGKPPPPDVIVPDEEPESDIVGTDEIKEPGEDDVSPIEPDPEEGHRPSPSDIQHM